MLIIALFVSFALVIIESVALVGLTKGRIKNTETKNYVIDEEIGFMLRVVESGKGRGNERDRENSE